MQAANRLQKSLTKGEPSFGGWQMLPGTNLTRTICRSARNLEWLLVDLEHGNISDDSMHEIVAATAACGVSPIVRVAEGQPWMIKRALDSGAHGILVPVIDTAEDARNVVRYSKFPPLGNRGFESLLAVEKFVEQHPHGSEVKELTGMEYLQQANSSLVIAVQIETKAGLENVREIAAVPGVDVLFIGPFDLSVNIGHPITNPEKMDPELMEAIQSIHDAAQAAGKATGIYCDTGEQAREYANKGFQMMSAMTDMVGMRKVFRQAFNAAKGDLWD
ncbi:Pyruvate/Phosphoenolpyruvate kinase-like domain-containing protein [Aspergillus caelatus]|uniref:Pyruvate/Phosphoenolpyruvate kinase-like domain-containing protein n=1 Tax=Aspergillus caelatus TaxID=61420 RepID=A0A5N7AIQ6_9EURO|nr:Pyruvate/Phosphoenolpyruvate kinase-like domain-containing protein [Aspergillus caelatus]KAE8368889.1 Pyruvate/Phosphoenolpyruvate kinase-like domain-containing protein [Aspergillus caelatus]